MLFIRLFLANNWKKNRGSPCLFKRKGEFISLLSLVWGKSLTFCTCTRPCARANDAKIVRSRDAQCNREIKFDVTWSYVKRQTSKMTSEFEFFSSNPSFNHIKNRKMSPTTRLKYKYFHSTVQRAKDRRQKFHFCRLPFDVRPRNVKLNLSNTKALP